MRFVEKQMVKNLRVFGVPLVGVERGRRVFECPHCRACVEAPAENASKGGDATASSGEIAPDADASARRAFDARLERARDQMWLWKRRAELADAGGDVELFSEARRLWTAAEHDVKKLEDELAKRGPVERVAPREPERPAIVARAKSAGGVEPDAGHAFAALKARIAQRARGEHEGDYVRENERVTEPDPLALEARLDALEHGDVDDALGALKARMAGGSTTPRDPSAYDALKRQLREPAVEPRAEPPAAAPTPRDDDPGAALKARLKKKS